MALQLEPPLPLLLLPRLSAEFLARVGARPTAVILVAPVTAVAHAVVHPGRGGQRSACVETCCTYGSARNDSHSPGGEDVGRAVAFVGAVEASVDAGSGSRLVRPVATVTVVVVDEREGHGGRAVEAREVSPRVVGSSRVGPHAANVPSAHSLRKQAEREREQENADRAIVALHVPTCAVGMGLFPRHWNGNESMDLLPMTDSRLPLRFPSSEEIAEDLKNAPDSDVVFTSTPEKHQKSTSGWLFGNL